MCIHVVVMLHANRSFSVLFMLPSVACPIVPYFSISHKRHEFLKKKIEREIF